MTTPTDSTCGDDVRECCGMWCQATGQPAFRSGQRVSIWGDDKGTVIDGPHPDWNGAYRVAIDGDGLNYVIADAIAAVPPLPPVPDGEVIAVGSDRDRDA